MKLAVSESVLRAMAVFRVVLVARSGAFLFS